MDKTQVKEEEEEQELEPAIHKLLKIQAALNKVFYHHLLIISLALLALYVVYFSPWIVELLKKEEE